MQKEGRVRGSGSGACATGAQTLREFFRQEVRPELRAVAALQLWLVGPQLAILNGVVSLLTSRVENKALATYVSEQSGASANLQLTTGALEVLACIAFRQPISQAEIDQLFRRRQSAGSWSNFGI
ncbi:MAG: SMC-Scp complex subunit ScpB [Terrimicrobiaceae bacterium]